MNCRVKDVLPAKAREWLKTNTLNRPIRKKYVQTLSESMQRGEWAVNHQPIAMNGKRLIDGQHRLMAVIQSGLPAVRMSVVLDAETETFDTIDIGVKRNNGDIFREDMHIMHPISFIGRLIYRGSYTPRELRPIYDNLQKPIRELVALYVRGTPKLTAAPIKVGALAAILSGEPKSYVHPLFKKICDFDLTELPPVAQGFIKQVSLGTTRTTD